MTSVTGIIKNECNDINKITVNAKQIIISAGSIASSEILLKNNLSNRNKQVGNTLASHTFYMAIRNLHIHGFDS